MLQNLVGEVLGYESCEEIQANEVVQDIIALPVLLPTNNLELGNACDLLSQSDQIDQSVSA